MYTEVLVFKKPFITYNIKVKCIIINKLSKSQNKSNQERSCLLLEHDIDILYKQGTQEVTQ